MKYLVSVFFIFLFFFPSLVVAKHSKHCKDCHGHRDHHHHHHDHHDHQERENRLVRSSQFLTVDYASYIDDDFDPYYLVVLSDGSRWTIFIEEGVHLPEGIVIEKRILDPIHYLNPDGYRYLLVFHRDEEVKLLYRYDEG